jgi:hypothetical protein
MACDSPDSTVVGVVVAASQVLALSLRGQVMAAFVTPLPLHVLSPTVTPIIYLPFMPAP